MGDGCVPPSVTCALKRGAYDHRYESTKGIATRPFGRHREPVSMIGLGGGHLVRPSVSEADAVYLIRTAIDEGITFLDTAWDYGDGASEHRFGQGPRGSARWRLSDDQGLRA